MSQRNIMSAVKTSFGVDRNDRQISTTITLAFFLKGKVSFLAPEY
jgi:hypothetical protein